MTCYQFDKDGKMSKLSNKAKSSIQEIIKYWLEHITEDDENILEHSKWMMSLISFVFKNLPRLRKELI